MVRINRVYTRKGDSGNTSLVGGRAIPKDHLRVESYGTVDELNALLGIVRSINSEKPADNRRDGLDKILQLIQQRLFDLGAELATQPGDEFKGQVRVDKQDVDWLEEVIDTMNEELNPLESFVLPGGGQLNAFLHQARVVCRRTERIVVTLGRKEQVGEFVLPYLNRLSDALFVFSRWVSATMDEAETLWQPGLAYDDSWRW
ncbi:MAG: cob(I)yrinic acid a,c-diamide adenosyltransferase [SAR324 cluster bacterium]|nr:cob(I)yrinic acid a,c-diamide adenosyltransferase [SAR324 cluster bacterium]MCZ6841858.1 cob(I)yrinic acid a,c-diamide adenosyltransferase [SAR324 cluster bacterium]